MPAPPALASSASEPEERPPHAAGTMPDTVLGQRTFSRLVTPPATAPQVRPRELLTSHSFPLSSLCPGVTTAPRDPGGLQRPGPTWGAAGPTVQSPRASPKRSLCSRHLRLRVLWCRTQKLHEGLQAGSCLTRTVTGQRPALLGSAF